MRLNFQPLISFFFFSEISNLVFTSEIGFPVTKSDETLPKSGVVGIATIGRINERDLEQKLMRE
jgi:hypothetical protein